MIKEKVKHYTPMLGIIIWLHLPITYESKNNSKNKKKAREKIMFSSINKSFFL